MELIDAEKFKKEITAAGIINNTRPELIKALCDAIDRQPVITVGIDTGDKPDKTAWVPLHEHIARQQEKDL